jgi:thiosulfate reductase cytochrome b subunit
MTLQSATPASAASEAAHPLFIRITHWVNAFALFVMILSGWRIYDASPLYAFEFPRGLTLGGWLAGALALHFSAMWLLFANSLLYLAYGLISGHFWRNIRPLGPRAIWRDFNLALQGRLPHRPGRYNAVQRLVYVGVALVLLAAVLSGFAIWKPVQLQELTELMGGFETARRVHFFAMAGLVLFIVLHVTVAARTPGLIASMFTGRAAAQPDEEGR